MQCIVPTCDRVSSNTSTQDITFFVFPTQPSLRQQWLHALGKREWQLTETDAVCSKHFRSEDLYATRQGLFRLRQDAVPVLQMTRDSTKCIYPRDCSNLGIPLSKTDNYELNKISLRKENMYSDADTDLHEVSLKKSDNMVKVERVQDKDMCSTTDELKLRILNKNTVVDDFKREDAINLNYEDKSNFNLSSSGFLEVNVNCPNTKDDIDNVKSGSDKYSIFVEIKAEKQEDDVRLDTYEEGNTMLHNEYLINGMESGHSIFGEDYAPDVSILSRVAGEKGAKDFTDKQFMKAPSERQLMVDRHSQVKSDGLERELTTSHVVNEVEVATCDRCNYKVNDPRHIECLIVTQPGDRPYSCEVCKKAFKFKNKLVTHVRIHIGHKPFACNVCDKSFRLKNKLKVHSRIHTNIKPYVCHVCNKGFYEGRSLKYHLTTHTDDKPFPCNVCEKSFAYSSGLQRHMKIHTGDRPFSCQVCEKTFKQKCNLERHLRVHSGEKPYPCHICKKNFIESGHLQIHLRIHSGEKPFICDVCDKRFTIKNGLLRHMRIHTGDRPYACHMCQKTFNEKSNFLKHSRICKKKPFNRKIMNFIPEIIYLTQSKKKR